MMVLVTLSDSNIARLDQDRAMLKDEIRLWKLLRDNCDALAGRILPEDRINGKTLRKFVVLALIVQFLTRNEEVKKLGAHWEEIYEFVSPKAKKMSEPTFKSHLLRFKRENRITQNHKKFWVVGV